MQVVVVPARGTLRLLGLEPGTLKGNGDVGRLAVGTWPGSPGLSPGVGISKIINRQEINGSSVVTLMQVTDWMGAEWPSYTNQGR